MLYIGIVNKFSNFYYGCKVLYCNCGSYLDDDKFYIVCKY